MGEKHKQEQRTENIIGVGLPGDDDCLPHSSNGTEGLAIDSERRGGKKKRITCQYLFPQAAWIEKDTLHSLGLFPLKPIQEVYLCLGSRGLEGVAWER